MTASQTHLVEYGNIDEGEKVDERCCGIPVLLNAAMPLHVIDGERPWCHPCWGPPGTPSSCIFLLLLLCALPVPPTQSILCCTCLGPPDPLLLCASNIHCAASVLSSDSFCPALCPVLRGAALWCCRAACCCWVLLVWAARAASSREGLIRAVWQRKACQPGSSAITRMPSGAIGVLPHIKGLRSLTLVAG